MPDPDVFPLSTDSYLEVLGVGASVDDASLSAAWRARSRRWHPDRFALSDAATRESAEWAAALANDAYRALADPFDRAAYLLLRHRAERPEALKGRVPATLFAEMLEIQEMVEEAVEAADAVAAADGLQRILGDLESRLRALKEQLRSAFRDFDTGDVDASLDSMREVVAVHGYLRRASETVDNALRTIAPTASGPTGA